MPDRGHLRAGYLNEVRDPATGEVLFLRGRFGSFEIRAYRNQRAGDPAYSLTIGLRPRVDGAGPRDEGAEP